MARFNANLIKMLEARVVAPRQCTELSASSSPNNKGVLLKRARRAGETRKKREAPRLKSPARLCHSAPLLDMSSRFEDGAPEDRDSASDQNSAESGRNQTDCDDAERRPVGRIRLPMISSRASKREALRKQFIKVAKNHIGEPYAQTDCCRLVRLCVNSLPQFGFRLDKADQGVMYDTLQGVQIPQHQLRPGDLIFYAADYRDPEKAPKRHNMAHIEIYLGPGERCIGSRSACWSYEDRSRCRETSKVSGVQLSGVQIYESFRCISRKWFRPRHVFVSLDQWLDGQCEFPVDFIEQRRAFVRRRKARRARGRAALSTGRVPW